MRDSIDMRVRFHGEERLLRLVDVGGEWHAALLIPGETDLLTEECPAPSPLGTCLPIMLLKGFELRLERLSGNVESMAMGQLMLSGRVSAEDGWVRVHLQSIMADYHDDIGHRPGKRSLAALKAGGNRKRPQQQKARDKEMER